MCNKVSVVMGVYNSNPIYLSESIESILNQTFSDFEFIICNDCSTNNDVEELLTKYKKLDQRIKLIKNKQNSGLAASLNHCLKVASGEYIARMDDDDISHLDRFEKQVSFLGSHPDIDIVGCNINFIDKYGKVWGSAKNVERPSKESFLFATPFTHPTVMIRKKAYDSVNGYSVDKRTRRTEDYDMFMRMYAKGISGYNLQEVLFDYRMDTDGYRKQKFKYRVDEAIIKYRGFKLLGLLPKGYLYLAKPIISGLVPSWIKQKRDKRKFGI